MKIFVDANILVTVLNSEYPLFPSAARILSLNQSKKFRIYTSPICLAIAFYFAEKKSGTQRAKEKIKILSQQLKITNANKKTVRMTSENPKINDFEDGLEYYSAIESGCEMIVTEDTADFYFSEIQVLNCDSFISYLGNR